MTSDRNEMIENKNLVISFSVGVSIILGLSCAAAVILYNTNLPDYVISTNESISGSLESDKFHERTFLMLKPDTVQRGLIGQVIQRLERKGFKLIAIKLIFPSQDLIEKHYESSIGRDHFPDLLEFMTSGPVIPMVWEGLNAVKAARKMIGHSNPAESLPGTIRADYSICRERSIIHGAETLEDAKREINLWFHEHELVSWTPTNFHFLYEI